MVVVTLAKKEQKWEIMRTNYMLRGRIERIGKLKEIAKKEERAEKRVYTIFKNLSIIIRNRKDKIIKLEQTVITRSLLECVQRGSGLSKTTMS